MSPGRQKVSDDEVFAAAQRAMTRQGPHELTLADIAAEAGVIGRPAGAAVRQQARAAAGPGGALRRQRRARCSPACARPIASRWPLSGPTRRAWRDLAVTPEALSRNLAYLQIDLTDPEFRAHLLANARATQTRDRSAPDERPSQQAS